MSKKALRESREHWRRLEDAVRRGEEGTASFEGWSGYDCALCDEYFIEAPNQDEKCCAGCPVSVKTGRHLCQGTPYHAARVRLQSWVGSKDEFFKENMKACALMHVVKMREYLEDLEA